MEIMVGQFLSFVATGHFHKIMVAVMESNCWIVSFVVVTDNRVRVQVGPGYLNSQPKPNLN